MDFMIDNYAPDSDVVVIRVGDNGDSIKVTISREENGQVHILVLDKMDGGEHRMVLGQSGFTNLI